MNNVDLLVIVILLAVMILGLAVYILAMALNGALKLNHSLSSQILTLKAHTQAGPHAAAQVLRAQSLAGLANQKKPEKPMPPKETPRPFTVKSSFR